MPRFLSGGGTAQLSRNTVRPKQSPAASLATSRDTRLLQYCPDSYDEEIHDRDWDLLTLLAGPAYLLLRHLHLCQVAGQTLSLSLVVSGFGLIQPEIESAPTRTDLGRIRIQFFSQIGSDFGSE